MNEVQLPALGESVTEGTITRWLKKVGDSVAIDEPLVEVSTDKVDTEIPSPVAGILQEIRFAEDETVEVGAVLAVIGEAAPASLESSTADTPPQTSAPDLSPTTPAVVETASAETEQNKDSASTPPASPEVAAPVAPPVAAPVAPPVAAPVAPPVAAPVASPVAAPVAATVDTPVAAPVSNLSTTTSDANYVTPIVRKLANDSGISLATIAGTGIGGRIRKEDVLAAASSLSAGDSASAFVPAPASDLRGTTEPMSRLRKVLAERAVASMQQSAQLTSVVEVDVTRIANMRKAVQQQFTEKTGVKLTFMPFFNLATAEALRAHPKINSSIEGETIVFHPTENISFAVDTERGLLTPVIRNAAELNLAETAKQIADMAERTRSNKLTPDELSGGTFTLTNTGSRGALFDTPVVFMPQSAILGTGIVTRRPVVLTDSNGEESIAIRSMVYLALSYDHRNIDGADAARFLTDLKHRLEEGNFESQLGI